MDYSAEDLRPGANEILKSENISGQLEEPRVDLLNLIAEIIVEIIIRESDEQRNRVHKKK